MSTFPLLQDYLATLNHQAPGTVTGYRRALEAFAAWLAERPGSDGAFQPAAFTKTAVGTYFAQLEQRYSPSYRTLVKSALSGLADWLIEEDLLRRNPTRGLQIEAQPLLAPRILDEQQRYILKSLVERADDPRGAALFALGYYAGCRVSDVSWLRLEHVHLSERGGWIKVGHKGGKQREIDLMKPARQALAEYLPRRDHRVDSPFVFPSQRAERLSEAGIHHWFRTLKAQAKKDEWELIGELSYHDLRHDFAHRAREAGWLLEEIAYYLGHITKRGTPAVQTTVRYTQASREQIKAKLKLLR
jgi:site-specific recombinase XerD